MFWSRKAFHKSKPATADTADEFVSSACCVYGNQFKQNLYDILGCNDIILSILNQLQTVYTAAACYHNYPIFWGGSSALVVKVILW